MQCSMTTVPGCQQGLDTLVDQPQDYQFSRELVGKWRIAKEVNDAHLAKIYEVNLMQKKMSKIHKRLDHHYLCQANSKEVITKHISLMREQPRSRNQYKAELYVQNNPISQSLGGNGCSTGQASL